MISTSPSNVALATPRFSNSRNPTTGKRASFLIRRILAHSSKPQVDYAIVSLDAINMVDNEVARFATKHSPYNAVYFSLATINVYYQIPERMNRSDGISTTPGQFSPRKESRFSIADENLMKSACAEIVFHAAPSACSIVCISITKRPRCSDEWNTRKIADFDRYRSSKNLKNLEPDDLLRHNSHAFQHNLQILACSCANLIDQFYRWDFYVPASHIETTKKRGAGNERDGNDGRRKRPGCLRELVCLRRFERRQYAGRTIFQEQQRHHRPLHLHHLRDSHDPRCPSGDRFRQRNFAETCWRDSLGGDSHKLFQFGDEIRPQLTRWDTCDLRYLRKLVFIDLAVSTLPPDDRASLDADLLGKIVLREWRSLRLAIGSKRMHAYL